MTTTPDTPTLVENLRAALDTAREELNYWEAHANHWKARAKAAEAKVTPPHQKPRRGSNPWT